MKNQPIMEEVNPQDPTDNPSWVMAVSGTLYAVIFLFLLFTTTV